MPTRIDYSAADLNRTISNGKDAVDVVVDSGANENWNWKKWKSGEAECWGYFKVSTAITQTTGGGGMYYSNAYYYSFPSGLFAATHAGNSGLTNCQISVDGPAILWFGFGSTYQRTQNFYFASPVKIEENNDFYIYINAKGWWK